VSGNLVTYWSGSWTPGLVHMLAALGVDIGLGQEEKAVPHAIAIMLVPVKSEDTKPDFPNQWWG